MPTPEELAAAAAQDKTATEAAAAEKKIADEKAAADAAAATKNAADEKAAAEKAAKEAEDKIKAAKNEVPATYDLKLSEGSPVTPERLQVIGEFAKTNKLTLGQAEAVVMHEEAQEAAYRQRAEGWLAQITADKEIGGDKAARSVELAKRVVLKYGSPDLVKKLETTKLGEEPEFVRLMSRIGRAYGEDTFFAAPNAAAGKKEVSRAEAFYPGQK